MKSLEKLKILARIMLCASIAACLFGLWRIVSGWREISHILSEGEATRIALAPCISEIAEGLVLAVHYFFVYKFCIHSLKHGVPFTHEGAKEIKILGFETIFLPILAWLISYIAYSGTGEAPLITEISIYEIVLGFALIIMSYVMDYGTTKIELGHMGHEEIRYLEIHYPDALNEARAVVQNIKKEDGSDAASDDNLSD